MDDHNQVIFPLNSQLRFTFPERSKDLPECVLTWRDGTDNHPEIPEEYWDGDKPQRLGGAGTLFRPGDANYLVQRGSHSTPSRIYPHVRNAEIGEKLKVDKPDVPGHGESFTQACMGNGETWSPFSKAGVLTQVLNIGCVAQYLNRSLEFDPETKTFKGDKEATALLSTPPRKGWEDFYNII